MPYVMDYGLLKTVHVTCVVISGGLFFGRGVLMLADSPLRRTPLLRVVPHLNDTVLLAAALWMSVLSRQYPLVEPWLTAKLIALLAYIGIGMVALSYGRTRRARFVAWITALGVYAYIVAVALTREVLPVAGS